jgi:hypothetical protein
MVLMNESSSTAGAATYDDVESIEASPERLLGEPVGDVAWKKKKGGKKRERERERTAKDSDETRRDVRLRTVACVCVCVCYECDDGKREGRER